MPPSEHVDLSPKLPGEGKVLFYSWVYVFQGYNYDMILPR